MTSQNDDHPNLPVPVGVARTESSGGRRRSGNGPSLSSYAAQLIGQPGVKRGLRGGDEVLKTARSTYLETEYSGPADRRPVKGQLRKTEI